MNQTTTKPASLAADGPKRAVLRYFGGKWAIAPWVLRHLPPHRIYVEPFGGAASVLMRKTRSEIEVYNDLDSEIVSLFRVIQDPMQCAALMRKLRRTPYARAEFDQAFHVVYRSGGDGSAHDHSRLFVVSPRIGVRSAQAVVCRRAAPHGVRQGQGRRMGHVPAQLGGCPASAARRGDRVP
ncbi:Site-specific DNA-methyltransferase [Vitreoscilla filiformis]|uniref:site-specific DNA-methyltransferase (adenine-specific) n=1 Tax=Vitreoscilla filiformis TaxID=63 RepID=A0A221KCA7_VITFI|nr:Site-specific DNA-methyltransferase [Vitreoscilla filiformis]